MLIHSPIGSIGFGFAGELFRRAHGKAELRYEFIGDAGIAVGDGLQCLWRENVGDFNIEYRRQLDKGVRQNSLMAALNIGDGYTSRWRAKLSPEVFLRHARLVPVVTNAPSDFRVKGFNLCGHGQVYESKEGFCKALLT